MTTSAISTDVASSIVAELGGSSPTNVEMMIGVGLVKDSDAVFFQYLGEEQQPQALVMPSGKPCTRMANIVLSGISVADDIGEFKSTKLNLFFTTSSGREIMITSGLQTIWSQCVITALMGVLDAYSLDQPLVLDSWKGDSKMRPCFAAVRQGGVKVSNQMMYDQLRDLRADRASDKLLQVMRDAVNVLNAAVSGGPVEEATVSVDGPTVVVDTDLF